MGFQIKNSKPNHPSVNRTFRFSPEVFDKIRELSEKHKISMNYLVNQCIEYALDQMED